ncbi:flagellar protein FlgN [Pseudomonas aeruginosa]|nr:flagellar protein FlgN [Pseudomonas aeruginosa]
MPDSPTLLDLFAEDIGHASQLLQLVDEEFQALERRELPVLQQLLGAKQPLMQQLERNGRARAEILREAGVSLDREGLARYARERADGAELLARGDELGELLERCQQANLRNGRIIRANPASTGSLLNILRGQDAPSLYDSRGGTASSSRQRPLSQA